MAVHSPYINTPVDMPMEPEYDNLAYQTVEILLDDVARQMASSNLSRYSRGSAGYKSGGPLRTSGSPRGSGGIGRRRTIIADAGYRQRLGLLDKSASPKKATLGSSLNTAYRRHTKAERPISWHTSSSHLTPQPATSTYQQYPVVMRDEATEEFPIFDMPPAPPVYSGYTSPVSAFSPQCLPYASQSDQQFHYPDTTAMPSNPTYDMYQNSGLFDQTTYIPPSTNDMEPSMYPNADWNFPANTYETSTTAPPTPQNFLPVQHPEPAFPSEESIPYQPLEDEEDSGEELIGMGLYDAPDHSKDLSTDPQLDNYRAMMMSNLGAVYQRPEPRGKGLKLEETWNPPEEDDEDADADADEDGEGEDDDDEDQEDQAKGAPSTSTSTTQQPAAVTNTNTSIPQFGENELRFLQGMNQ